jgi:hypothetical protein
LIAPRVSAQHVPLQRLHSALGHYSWLAIELSPALSNCSYHIPEFARVFRLTQRDSV